MKPHKHAEVIKAWADGAEVQSRTPGDPAKREIWRDVSRPVFHSFLEYRVKPTPPAPVIVKSRPYVWKSSLGEFYIGCVPLNDEGSQTGLETRPDFLFWLPILETEVEPE